MEIKVIILILIVPAFTLGALSIFFIKKLIKKIIGTNIKNYKDFINKSLNSSDILLEILIPKKYSQEYPHDFKKIRFFAISGLLFFIPTIILIFYTIFKPYFLNKEYKIPALFLSFFIISIIINLTLLKHIKK